jgi:hypothetical protein
LPTASPAILALVTLALVVVAPGAAGAQTPKPAPKPAPKKPSRPPGPRWLINAAAGAAISTSSAATDSFVLFLEPGSIVSSFSMSAGTAFEVGIGRWLWRGLGASLTLSNSRAGGTVTGVYTLPSPFVFDMPVTTTATTSADSHATNAQVDFLLSAFNTRYWQLVIAGGPMYSRVRQTLITDRFSADFEFPFTDITLKTAFGEAKGYGWGAHVGGSLARHLSPRFDLTGGVDWRRTNASLAPGMGHVAFTGNGLSLSIGARVKF